MLLKDYIIPEGDSSTTFEEDEKLPCLPLPNLSNTMQIYLESIKPFANDNNEYEQAVKVAKEFENGIGKVLHSKLSRKAKNEGNWLEKWWEDYAYHTPREPLLPYYNMVGCREITHKERYKLGKQIKFASLDCYYNMKLWILLRTEKLKPLKTIDKKPFSMSQYRNLFNCVRVPGQQKDSIRTYFKTEKEGPCPSNVIVIQNGHMFSINGLYKDGTPLTPPEWSRHLEIIQNISEKQRGSCVPILSCDYRTSWAKNRDYLVKLGNGENLALIDSAMYILCLDDACPSSESEIIHLCLNGDYGCRWPDKSFNSVFFNNGLPGGISDHSAFDGMVSNTAMHFVSLSLNESYDFWEHNKQVREGLEEPVEINFIIDSFIREEIENVYKRLEKEKHRFIIVREEFNSYGKEAIQNLKIHPDTFVQMALHLAYYKLYLRPASCYETATTRQFFRGRTETVRSCTTEVVTWIKAMLDSSTTNKVKADLLHRAIVKHDQLMAKARNNEGCDRHLFGLYCVALEEGFDVPDLFNDPLYRKSGGGGNFILSTSLTGYVALGGGVSPMCLDGYGVFYCIVPQRIYFTFSVTRDSYETSTQKYFRSVCESLKEMRTILEKHQKCKL